MENSPDLTIVVEEEYMQEDEDKPPDCGILITLKLFLSAFRGDVLGQIKNRLNYGFQLNIALQGAFAPLFCGQSA